MGKSVDFCAPGIQLHDTVETMRPSVAGEHKIWICHI